MREGAIRRRRLVGSLERVCEEKGVYRSMYECIKSNIQRQCYGTLTRNATVMA